MPILGIIVSGEGLLVSGVAQIIDVDFYRRALVGIERLTKATGLETLYVEVWVSIIGVGENIVVEETDINVFCFGD